MDKLATPTRAAIAQLGARAQALSDAIGQLGHLRAGLRPHPAYSADLPPTIAELVTQLALEVDRELQASVAVRRDCLRALDEALARL